MSQTTLHSRTVVVLFVCFWKRFTTRSFKHIVWDGGNGLYERISATVIIIIIINRKWLINKNPQATYMLICVKSILPPFWPKISITYSHNIDSRITLF